MRCTRGASRCSHCTGGVLACSTVAMCRAPTSKMVPPVACSTSARVWVASSAIRVSQHISPLPAAITRRA